MLLKILLHSFLALALIANGRSCGAFVGLPCVLLLVPSIVGKLRWRGVIGTRI